MKRRSFIQGLFTVSAAAGLGGHASQLPAESVASNEGLSVDLGQLMLLQCSVVAGFKFYEGENIWPKLKVGHELILAREPNNKYDERAVAVYWDDPTVYGDVRDLIQVGYIPRQENYALHQLMDRGVEISSVITELAYNDDSWKRVRLSTFFVDWGKQQFGVRKLAGV